MGTLLTAQHFLKPPLVSPVTSVIYNKATQTKPDMEKSTLPKTKYKHNLINLHSRVRAANLLRREDLGTQRPRAQREGQTRRFSAASSDAPCTSKQANASCTPQAVVESGQQGGEPRRKRGRAVERGGNLRRDEQELEVNDSPAPGSDPSQSEKGLLYP